MARALLGNGQVNTPRPNTHKTTMEDVSQGGMLLLFARQQRTNEDSGYESHDLFSVSSSLCNNRTAFSVRGLCRSYIRNSSVQFSSADVSWRIRGFVRMTFKAVQ
jgi:hypothetical protein